MGRHDFELLAPAGSFEILKAVIEAGADAVYVGGSRFGARAYANNFSEEELLDAIDYVHLRGKRLFLTVNTLFKNTELEELYEYLLPYYERGLDAVIVQDMGVISYLKEHFPHLPIHTSTQMTVTGVEGAKLLRDIGAERVVLARELSIPEMKRIREEADVELEAFVHGALCYSYSGQCLFSSLLGGRSGNRGRCAQPCRLPYAVLDEEKREYKKESYVLSLKDLCGINHLQKLREAGVYSLKIEGRMKQASYAAGVVSFYRKYIDLEQQVSKEDMQHLYELGNRCGFTKEYFEQKNDKSMVTFEKPSYERSNEALHQSIEAKYVGKKSQLPIYGQLQIRRDEPLRLQVHMYRGDEVVSAEVQGPEVSEAKNKPLAYEDVRTRMNKTGESDFFFEGLEIELDEDVFVPNGVLNQLRRDALDGLKAKLLEEFVHEKTQTGETDNAGYTQNVAANHTVDSCRRPECDNHTTMIASCETKEQFGICLRSPLIQEIYADSQMFSKCNYIEELRSCIKRAREADKRIFLRLPVIFREHTANFYRTMMEELRDSGLDGYVVRNYEELYFVREHFPDAQMVADHNLYTYNNRADEMLEELGAAYRTIPLELNQKEIRRKANADNEMVVYGYYPLMTTAGCVHKNTVGCDKKPQITYLKDRYQVCFPVKNFCNECYNVVYNSVPTLLHSEIERLEDMGLRRFRIDFTIETAEEASNVLDIFCGKGREIMSTKGHYKRGVE